MTGITSLRHYRVHLFPVIHVPLGDIEAASPQQAIQQAVEQTDLYWACRDAEVSYPDDISGYLADELVGDDEVQASHWFEDQHHSATPLLIELVRCLERPDHFGLQNALDDARQFLDRLYCDQESTDAELSSAVGDRPGGRESAAGRPAGSGDTTPP